MISKCLVFFACLLSSCTYSITMVHTNGTASDVVDESPSTSAHVSPNLSLKAPGFL